MPVTVHLLYPLMICLAWCETSHIGNPRGQGGQFCNCEPDRGTVGWDWDSKKLYRVAKPPWKKTMPFRFPSTILTTSLTCWPWGSSSDTTGWPTSTSTPAGATPYSGPCPTWSYMYTYHLIKYPLSHNSFILTLKVDSGVIGDWDSQGGRPGRGRGHSLGGGGQWKGNHSFSPQFGKE